MTVIQELQNHLQVHRAYLCAVLSPVISIRILQMKTFLVNFPSTFSSLVPPSPSPTSPLTARTNITLIEVEVFNSVQRLLWKFSKGNMKTTQQWKCAAVLQN